MNDKLVEMNSNIELIQKARKEIADLKAKKIVKRSNAWEVATGVAKEKEDYVRSVVSEIDKEIGHKEANIEYLYNRNSLLNQELVYFEDE